MPQDSPSLDQLLENPRLWRGRNPAQGMAGLASGYAELDRHLPGGGWPRQALTEILIDQYGIAWWRIGSNVRLYPVVILAHLGVETWNRQRATSRKNEIPFIRAPLAMIRPGYAMSRVPLEQMMLTRLIGSGCSLISVAAAPVVAGSCIVVVIADLHQVL